MTLGINLLCLDRLEEIIAHDSVFMLLNLTLRLLCSNQGVNFDLFGHDFAFKIFELQEYSILRLSHGFCISSFDLFLNKLALLAIPHDIFSGGLDLLSVVLVGADLVVVSGGLTGLKVAVELLEVKVVVDDILLKKGLLHVCLSELCLHIFEKTAGQNLDVSDLHC